MRIYLRVYVLILENMYQYIDIILLTNLISVHHNLYSEYTEVDKYTDR